MEALADILFSQGFGTRYECKSLVESGQILVNNQLIDDPYVLFDTSDLVLTYRNENWPYYEKAVIALNKPQGYECSLKPSAHPSVMTLLPTPLRVRGVQPVGRLDVDTTGLLILTDDGHLLHRWIHPKRHVPKTYVATCRYSVSEDMLDMLMTGVVLADDPRPVKAQQATKLSDYRLSLVLTQGKYHQVKRMIAACHNRCESLHRTSFGAYTLPNELQPGHWMWIRPEDVNGGAV